MPSSLHESPRTLADVIPPLHTHNETAAVKRINRAAANHHSLSCYNNELHSTRSNNMTEPPVSRIPYHDGPSLSKASSPSGIANQGTMSEDATITSASGDSATTTSTTTAPFFDRVSSTKKRSISLDTAHNDLDRHVESRGTTNYESLTKEELILALQSRDHVIFALGADESASHNKRIKTSTAIPSPTPTVSSASSSSVDEESAEKRLGFFNATATKKKKEQPPKSVVTEVVTPAPSSQIDEATMEQFRKLAFQGIKAQITWRPSCKSGTARFVHACMCDEATFRAFLNLGEKDKTKGYKYDVDAFQKDILRNVLMVRIRYGYLSLNGDVRVSYNKKLSEMKITGSFGV